MADISKPNLITGVADITLVKNEHPPAYYKQSYFRGYPLFPTRNTSEEYITVDDVLKTANKMLLDVSNLVRSKEILSTFTAARLMANNFNQLTINLDESLPSTYIHLNQSLDKISAAADSTKNLTDYLSRYPESLIRGKK